MRDRVGAGKKCEKSEILNQTAMNSRICRGKYTVGQMTWLYDSRSPDKTQYSIASREKEHSISDTTLCLKEKGQKEFQRRGSNERKNGSIYLLSSSITCVINGKEARRSHTVK